MSSDTPPGSRAILQRLLDERPTFHFDQTQDWSLGGAVLHTLVDRVRPGWRVVETGCGYSTVVLAAAGCELLTIAPSRFERAAIVAWCEQAGIALASTRWEESTSEESLPRLDLGVLDLVLVDGAHALPIPLVDWFYAGRALRAGGLMLIDDIQLPAPRLLRDFLACERARWNLVQEVDNCAVFERVGDAPLIGMDDWQGQAWDPHPPSSKDRLLSLVGRARSRLRIRGRVRALLGR